MATIGPNDALFLQSHVRPPPPFFFASVPKERGYA